MFRTRLHPQPSGFAAAMALFIGLGVGDLPALGQVPQLGGVIASRPMPNMERLSTALSRDRFVAYSPSQFNPLDGERAAIDTESIRRDLQAMRGHFSGLVTYSCDPRRGLDLVVPVARDLDMRVIIGVWDVRSVGELAAAVRLASEFPETVIAVLVGNETMLRGGKWEALEAALYLVQSALPQVPVSTSEPISSYGDDHLCQRTDFHAPNVHWIFHGDKRQDVDGAVAWLRNRVDALQSMYPKPIVVKEHGLPSGPEPFSEVLQSNYWAKASQEVPNSTNRAIVFFEAFDLPFKRTTQQSELSATEEHWGAWRQDRTPKPVVGAVSPIPVHPRL